MSAIFLSIVASALSVGATVPQILKILKKASTQDLSLACFSMHAVGGLLWSFYGAIIDAPVLAIEAALVAVLNVVVCIHILEQKQVYRPPTLSTDAADAADAADDEDAVYTRTPTSRHA